MEVMTENKVACAEQGRSVPQLRFREFDDGWESNKIEEMFLFKNGLNKEKEFFGRGTPIINFTDVYHLNGIRKSDIKGLVELNASEKERFSANKGDVFFTRTSETIIDIGMAAVLIEDVEDCVFSGFVLRATPLNNKLDLGFKKYCFSIHPVRKEIVTKSSFTTRALTSGTLLNKVVFNYPKSKSEQQKIATFLSSVDEKIQQLSKKKSLLEDYKKGVMQKIFSQELRFKDAKGNDYPDWEEKKLGEVFEIGSGRDYKHLLSGDIPVYGTGGYMTSVNDFLYDGESVCIGRKGTIDKPRFYNGKFWTVDTLFFTHSFKSSLPKFVYYTFQLINWKKYNEASGVPSLSKKTIEKIEILLPSLKEQQKIANFLSALDTKIEKVNTQINNTQAFKKGLLQQMFV